MDATAAGYQGGLEKHLPASCCVSYSQACSAAYALVIFALVFCLCFCISLFYMLLLCSIPFFPLRKGGKVYVMDLKVEEPILSIRGKPKMPCLSPLGKGKVRRLLPPSQLHMQGGASPKTAPLVAARWPTACRDSASSSLTGTLRLRQAREEQARLKWISKLRDLIAAAGLPASVDDPLERKVSSHPAIKNSL